MFSLTPGLPIILESRKNLEFHNSGKKKNVLEKLRIKKEESEYF